MSIQDRKTINRYLGNRGLATLDDPGGLVAQLGFLVEDEQHFLQILNRCEPAERRNMYEALRPHLSFEVKPLDVYISQLGAQAEAERLPTVDADGRFHAYRPAEIRTQVEDLVEEAVSTKHLTVTCRKCTKTATFHGGTRADVIYKLRAAGWTWGLDTTGEGSEICPDCPGTKN